MTTDIEPMIGAWYRYSDRDNDSENGDDSGDTFTVTSVDDREQLVEIQHYDGDLEEIDLDTWFDLSIELAEPPEDWSGPLDNVDAEDLDDGESTARAAGRRGAHLDDMDWEDDR